MNTDESNSRSLKDAADTMERVREAVRRAVIGQDDVIKSVVAALLSGGHVLLEGVPGLGKTLLVRALATAMRIDFSRVQFTPDLMPSDVSGHAIYDPKSEQFRIRKGPVFTNLLLADEINRAPAKTQAALLEVMQETQVTIEGHSYKLSPPFMTIATQNSIDHEGTYPLPEAQLDRFLFKVLIHYPDEKTEVDIVGNVIRGKIGDALDTGQVQTVASGEDLLNAQQLAANLHVEDRVIDYAVRIARSTRDWPGIAIGAGPRAPIAMTRAARALALLDGRDYVLPDDIKTSALPALRHRISLSPEMEIEAYRADDILGDILDKVEAPRT